MDDCPDHGPYADDDCPKCGRASTKQEARRVFGRKRLAS